MKYKNNMLHFSIWLPSSGAIMRLYRDIPVYTES